jgi:hypothetical protein
VVLDDDLTLFSQVSVSLNKKLMFLSAVIHSPFMGNPNGIKKVF